MATDTNSVDSYGFTPATQFTINANQRVRDALPFEDQTDFEESDRGFIATIPSLKVLDNNGKTAWDTAAYQFIEGEAPATVNPSLWRQATLNNKHGLYKIGEGIYQVRGYDLANMTVIEGDNGWLVVDPLTTAETASAAMAFVNEQLGSKPVKALLFTHSHIDHFGGALGILTKEQAASGEIPIIAPSGFMEEATSENIIAGMAMGRRAMYMYGKRLPRSVRGHIGSGLGKEPAYGAFGILEPNTLIEKTGQSLTLDGIRFEFQVVSGTEAPAEFTFFLPEKNAFGGAELVSRTMHNLYTLRGTKVRDALKWSASIDEAIDLLGSTDLYFGSHHWPIWGTENIIQFLENQRDMYKYIHDQSVRMLNQGLTSSEIAEQLALPPALEQSFSNRGYYGTTKHNAKAVYQAYLGWYDANPANLNPLPPETSSVKYVKLMGGSNAVLANAQNAFDQGEYRWVAELLNHLVFAEPENMKAKSLLANTYDQLGYQSESGPWRDVYLTAAYELRHGGPDAGVDIAMMKGVLEHTPIENFLQSMAVRLKGPDAIGEEYLINFTFTDRNENYVVRVENGVLHHRKAEVNAQANATLKLTYDLFIKMAIGEAGIKDTLFSDDLSVEGSTLDLIGFFRLLDKPKGTFNVVTP
ncbi:alkyl sulfatase dimerization domain-containing protein [Litoribacillus peritrichatus]|uniref:Alkyl sulfatase dimerization domain-containing protein n=2 Tax=Litoribacillus peritrichatus TaxID=718191 RepID=A0ABP7M8V0_9GAMM